jgi:hypothetical protein
MLEQPDVSELGGRLGECLHRAQDAAQHPRRAAG